MPRFWNVRAIPSETILRAGTAVDPFARKRDRSGRDRVESRDAVEQRGFAGAVRPDQAADLAGIHLTRHAIERANAAETHRHVSDAKQRLRAAPRGGHRVTRVLIRHREARCRSYSRSGPDSRPSPSSRCAALLRRRFLVSTLFPQDTLSSVQTAAACVHSHGCKLIADCVATARVGRCPTSHSRCVVGSDAAEVVTFTQIASASPKATGAVGCDETSGREPSMARVPYPSKEDLPESGTAHLRAYGA